MNKRSKILTIAGCIFAAALIVIFVVIVNADKIGDRIAKKKTAELLPEETVSENTEFLSDNQFLDDYQPNQESSEDKSGPKKVSLLTTSVAGDMRVTVLDEEGKAVKGEEFFVDVKNLGEYKDVDKDGIIYIAGISAGKYDVSLKNTTAYVCEDSVNVEVSEKIKYEVLEDVSYLIKTEEEIEQREREENLMLQRQKIQKEENAEDDETESEILEDLLLDISEAEPGIDVSKWNAEIDWEKVYASGVRFAIIRVGYRGWSDGELVEDPMFRQNIEGARAAGIKVGLYFFTQAIDEREAIEEASMCIQILEEMEIDEIEYPIFIDTEWSTAQNGRADNLEPEIRTKVVDAFCKTVEKAGKTAGIYASREWYYHYLIDDELYGHIRWVAEYREKPLYTGNFQIWQYSSIGHIEGIEGDVDLNISYLYANEMTEEEKQEALEAGERAREAAALRPPEE